ncbi:acyl carrier protein [Shewanella sp.]|uniref:acyl carrier protein n=1 Tax=Shewanella sp. TaxID=50422 RepID=UPI0035660425
MEYAVLVIILFILITLLLKKGDKNRAIEIDKIFEGRMSLSPHEFYETYYSDKAVSEDVVIDIINILETEIETDHSRLIPSDDLSENLRYLFEFDSMADIAVIESVERKFSIKISDMEAENIKTINDLVLFVNSKIDCTIQANSGRDF